MYDDPHYDREVATRRDDHRAEAAVNLLRDIAARHAPAVFASSSAPKTWLSST